MLFRDDRELRFYMSQIELHSGCAQVGRNPARVPESVRQVYKALARVLDDRNLEEQHHLRSLQNEQCIWTGSCFADPASAVLEGNQNLEPALFTVDRTLTAEFQQLLLTLTVHFLWLFLIHSSPGFLSKKL